MILEKRVRSKKGLRDSVWLAVCLPAVREVLFFHGATMMEPMQIDDWVPIAQSAGETT